jgi:hypothetical protein
VARQQSLSSFTLQTKIHNVSEEVSSETLCIFVGWDNGKSPKGSL